MLQDDNPSFPKQFGLLIRDDFEIFQVLILYPYSITSSKKR